ncbi:transmembrane protein 256 homolog [Dreissena polymorpha]|uniref:transmembrane protein 256 homolog n=1 Tax=Dreissena polymorpha TaxID=45954 RepID=UPI002264AAED|nr:transmembrane protein 256 homolog [Dreissena polymorpha]
MEQVNNIVGAVSNIFFTRKEQQQIGKVSREVIKEVKTLIDIREMAGNNFVRVAGLSGAVAVAMAAYGAHAFNHEGNEEEQKLKNVFESGNKMHLFHSVAMMAVPLTRNPNLVGCTMATGMLIFSGSCYYQAITKDGRIRKITPYGGMLLIISWLLMIL